MIGGDVSMGHVVCKRPQSRALYTIAQAGNSNCRRRGILIVANHRGIIKASKHVTAGHLIVNLNPVIRGWANYHRHVTSKRTFSRVDHAIFRALWQWASVSAHKTCTKFESVRKTKVITFLR